MRFAWRSHASSVLPPLRAASGSPSSSGGSSNGTTSSGTPSSGTPSSSSNGTPSSPGESSDSNDGGDRQKKRGGAGDRRRGDGGGWVPPSWLSLESAAVQVPLRIAVNVAMLYFLMRMWPAGGPSGHGLADTPGGRPGRTEDVTVVVPFSDFLRRVKKDEVQSVVLDGSQIIFSPRSPASDLAALFKSLPSSSSPDSVRDLSRVRLTLYSQRPADYVLPYERLENNGVIFSVLERRGNTVATIMMWALAAGFVIMALNRLPFKLPNAKGPGRRHSKGDPKGDKGVTPAVTFADVAGVDEAKEELAEVVEFLRDPERFQKLGARPPCGVLLVGPPGTGKTMLAKAVAGEADVPFFSISASEFVELYVGMGAMRVRELFANARKEAPSIVFIDEIDAVAKGRSAALRSVGNDEREQTLNQLLTELDGFDSDKDNGLVICIAATNRADVLDSALLRPGRFDRRVSVERPDRLGREQILGVHMKRRGLPLDSDVDTGDLASMTTGFTGADLANLVNEAALLAGRAKKSKVGRTEFDAAVLRAVAGVEKKRSILTGVEKSVVARHEAGHALVATALLSLLPASACGVSKLSIIPRSGGALGFTYMPPRTEDRALMFDAEIRGQLAVLMGGRAAEALTCEALSTGAVDDIRRATELAQAAVAEYGLSTAVGPVNVGVLSGAASEDLAAALSQRGAGVAAAVEAEVRSLISGALTAAMAALAANQRMHRDISTELEARERLEGVALAAMLEGVAVPGALSEFVLYGKVAAESSRPAPFGSRR
ncbi:hypothetical protein FOA52_001192 [Chlamydomonas sp. UWO 241]|nr:hypothetical protein FOA52_001192 [Chlamydomonas sp. UWO 241]